MPRCPHCGREMGSVLSFVSEGKNNSLNGKKVPIPVYRCIRCGFIKKNRRAKASQSIPPMPKILSR